MKFSESSVAYHRQQAYTVMDRLIAARDPVTGMLPLHVKTEDGHLVPTDHYAAGLDMGRQTAGLVMTADLARDAGDSARAQKYLDAAEANYAAGKKLLADGDVFVQRRDFNDDGSVKSTEVGEPGKNGTRVNPRLYAFRGALELYRETGKPEYKADFDRYFQRWVSDFHDPIHGGFYIHSNPTHPQDHTERGSFVPAYDGKAGAKGNDGTIYALSGVLLPANDLAPTKQTQALVKEQLDLILNTFHKQNGLVWENYTVDFKPVSEDWQSQAMEGTTQTSHVAIGGHTAMASGLVLEGAEQLHRQGAIDDAQYQKYVDGAVKLFSDFATQSGGIDWNRGAVHNAMRVEEPDPSKRWLKNWGDAGWQQAEFIQTMIDLDKVGRLHEVQGPQGQHGEDLLNAAEKYYQDSYSQKADYAFTDYFGNPDVYHVPQVATYVAGTAK